MGIGLDALDEGDVMNKIAFCFPGQGSIEAGMGRDIAEAVPAARDVFFLRIGRPARSTRSTRPS